MLLNENSALPMMYMDDAIKATIQIMQAPSEQIKIRSSYNLAAMSFTPKELAEEIKNIILISQLLIILISDKNC